MFHLLYHLVIVGVAISTAIAASCRQMAAVLAAVSVTPPPYYAAVAVSSRTLLPIVGHKLLSDTGIPYSVYSVMPRYRPSAGRQWIGYTGMHNSVCKWINAAHDLYQRQCERWDRI